MDTEPDLEGLEKRWIINKIVNETEKQRIEDLLIQYNQKYVTLSLDYDELLRRTNIHYDGDYLYLDSVRYVHDTKRGELANALFLESIIEHMYRDRNNFVINNNGVRNAMIENGVKEGFKYILAFDGNCYITPSAWKEVY